MHLFPFKVPQDSEDYSNFVESIEEKKILKIKLVKKANSPCSTFITNSAHYTEVLARFLHVKVFVDWNGKIRN